MQAFKYIYICVTFMYVLNTAQTVRVTSYIRSISPEYIHTVCGGTPYTYNCIRCIYIRTIHAHDSLRNHGIYRI